MTKKMRDKKSLEHKTGIGFDYSAKKKNKNHVHISQ